jgi:VCBS repeat-containing protein
MAGTWRAWRILLAAVFGLLLLCGPAGATAQVLGRPGADQDGNDAQRLASLPPEPHVEQAGCTPRPAVGVRTERAGEGRLSVTITAGTGSLVLVRFGEAPNARLDLPNLPANVTPPLSIKPNLPSYTFILRTASAGTPVTLPLTITDGCGEGKEWHTFVGSGTAGLQVQADIADPAPIVEGNGGTADLTFTVTLSAAAAAPVSVQYATADLTATAPADYAATTGTLTFSPGETSRTIAVPVKGDTSQEGTETFEVRLANPNGLSLGRATATGTIADDDGAPSLAIADASTPEGNGGTHDAVFAVSLSPASGRPVTVQYATADDTATSPADYAATSGTLTFAPGETSKPIAVSIKGDTLTEGDERFFVRLSNPSNASIATAQAVGTIQDDEGAPGVSLSVSGSPFSESGGTATVTATVSNPATQPVTVTLGFTGTATQGADYAPSDTKIVIPALGTSGSITLTGVADALSEGNESVVVSITGVTNGTAGTPNQVTAAIADDDSQPTVALGLSGSPFAENGGTATVTATLSGLAGQDTTVTLGFAGTATRGPGAGADYTASNTQIVIPALQSSASITLTGVDDSAPEGDETAIVGIQSVSAGATAGSPDQVTATITDDDAPFVTLGISPASVAEAGGTATVTATLSQPAILPAVITLGFAGTATDGTDYTHTGTTISIPQGQTSGTLVLTGAQDTTYDPDETVVVTIAGATNAVDQAPPESVSATIADDDGRPAVTLDLTGSLLAESGGQATVTATLSNLSNEPVTVGLLFTGTATAPGAPSNDYTVTPAGTSIVIAPGQPSGSITLTAVDDATVEGPETIVADIASVTNGTENGTQQVTATIADDDAPPIVTTTGGTSTFQEGSPPTIVDPGVTVADADSLTLASATVTISNAIDGPQEVLAADTSGTTIAASYTAPTLTLSGPDTVGHYQQVLQSVTYANTSSNPTATLRTIAFAASDGAHTGSPATKGVAVQASDNAPVAVADAYNATEDSALVVDAALGVLANDTDVDTPHAALTAVLVSGPQNGSLTLGNDGAFAYTPGMNVNGSDSFTYKAFDGTANSNTVTVTLTIAAVNDPPSITSPPSLNTSEDQPIGVVGLSVTDVDAGSGSLSVTLHVSNGVLSIGSTDGLSFTTGDGTNDPSLTFSGSLADINTALSSLVYQGNQDYSGPDTIEITVNDNGNTGAGGQEIVSRSVFVSVSPVNDPPVNTVPGPQTLDEDTALSFSTANGNAISVGDADAGTGGVTVTLSTAAGTLAFGSVANLTGVINNAATITATGTIADLNAALQGTVLTPTPNLNGPQSIAMTTNDNGNTGGAPQTVGSTINLSITALNDAPSITAPISVSTVEDVPFSFGGGALISAADVDAGGGSVTVTLSVGHGTLTLSSTSGLAQTGNGTASVSASGTLSDLNTALNGLTYQGTANYNGPDALSVGVNDNGNTGGGSQTASATVGITVAAVNDPPTARVPGTLPAQAGIPIDFPATTLGGTDVEDGSNVAIDLTPGAANGGTVTLNANGSFRFTPDPQSANGTASFSYRVADSGNDGGVSGTPLASGYVVVSLNVAGPELYFVKAAASGDCTLGDECDLATAVTKIGARADTRIFISDANSHNAAVPLTSGGWLIGQGITGVPSFDVLFGISPPGQGVLIPRPLLGLSRPTIQQTVTLNTNAAVRGLNISSGTSTGLADPTPAITGVAVNDVSVTTSTAAAVSLSNVTGPLSFTSISSDGGTTPGVSITNASGGFTIAGSGSPGTGGTIQNKANGIVLSNVADVSIDRLNIYNTTGSGIQGTGVTNFSLTNGTINNVGTDGGSDESSIAFNASAAGNERNLSGAVTITGIGMNGTGYHGIDILSFAGTISSATISNNTITSSASASSSFGSGIRVQALGSGGSVATITTATLASNTISNFPNGSGIIVNCGNPSTGGTGGGCGTPGSATNKVAITGNTISGQTPSSPMGVSAIAVSVTGGSAGSRSQANFDISNNGTAMNPLANVAGTGIGCLALGFSTATCTIADNVIAAHNTLTSPCISAGVDRVIGAGDTPDLTATITGNNVSACDGSGIFAGALNSTGTARLKIQGNTLAAPLTGTRAGMQISSGTPAAAGTNTTVCLNLTNNASAGSGGSSGIWLSKVGTSPTTNTFGVNGMSTTSSPGVEAYVNGNNPVGGGTALTGAASGFTNCSLP